MKEYIFKTGNVINVIQIKKGQNSKLGIGTKLIGTYHFAAEQIEKIDLSLDTDNCLNCPFSTAQGDDSCYTHKGLQKLGLVSMLKRLHKLLPTIKEFSQDLYNKFIRSAEKKNVSFARFGVYGEPIFLPIAVIKKIVELVKRNYTGYTHQWGAKYQAYSAYFMASVHNALDTAVAKGHGWRTFITADIGTGINCPASKEAGKKTTCAKCALCSGTDGKGKTDIFIKKH